MSTLTRAKEIATEAHRGQHRWGGEPYITHPEEVARRVIDKGVECEIVAWLHDVIEDTDWTYDDLVEAGFSEKVIKAVMSITKRHGEEYDKYIDRVSRNPIARVVKIADISHNLESLKKGSMRDKYRLAIRYLQSKRFLYSGPPQRIGE